MGLHMRELAQFFKTLGDANRLSIVRTIGRESKSVSELISATNLSQTLVSFHLRALREAGLVTTRRDGPFIYYSLADRELMDILNNLAHLAGLENELYENSDNHRNRATLDNRRIRNP
jgi:DNA-binding transcriptional ArsR family regulator